MDKVKQWWGRYAPTKRRWIQLYTALLYNCNLKGFPSGRISTGAGKNICVPGLNCYSCPGAVGACPLGALQNALAASDKRLPAYVLGTLVMFGALFGRLICGFACTFGLIQELLHKVPVPKIGKNRITRALSYVKYILLAVFVIAIPLSCMGSLPVPAFCKYICPSGTLEGALALLSAPANRGMTAMLGSLFTRKLVILLGVVTACLFLYRPFCRFLCPLGAIYGLFNRYALMGMEVDESLCIHCDKCTRCCKMDVRCVGDRECIGCGACMEACPVKAIRRRGPKALKRPAVKKLILAAAAALLAAGLLTCALRADGPSLPQDARMADFTVPVYGSEESFTLSDCRGSVTIINYWATWCTPCCRELPEFQRFYEDYGDRVRIIAIHAQMCTDDVEAFIAENGFTLPFGWDREGTAAAAAGDASLLPRTVVLDREGNILYNEAASVDYEKLAALVEAAS